MPELPDVEVYIEALEKRILGRVLTGIRLANPFVLRTVEPRPAELAGRTVTGCGGWGSASPSSWRADSSSSCT
jgi:formamidopyrimidine-DNA glycosylase